MSLKNIIDNTHESKLVSIINDSISKVDKEPISLATENLSVSDIFNASKFSGLRNSYTDIILDNRTRKPLNISLENVDSEFVVKTDVKGLNLIYPGILIKFINEVRRNFKDGSDITSFSSKIPKIAAQRLMKGITVLGGPVDLYLFDNVKMEYEFYKKDKVLYLKNAYFQTPDELASEKSFYLRFSDGSENIIKNLNENRYDLIKHELEIVQEISNDSKMINIV